MSFKSGLAAVEEFGRAAERHEFAAIGVGGVLEPGESLSEKRSPGKEEYENESAFRSGGPAEARAREGSSARSWTRSRRSQAEAAACTSSHAFGDVVGSVGPIGDGGRGFGGGVGDAAGASEFEELASYFPDVRVAATSSRFDYLALSATPFPDIGARFKIVYEVPRPGSIRGFAERLRTSVASVVEDAVDDLLGERRPFRRFSPRVSAQPMVPPVRAWARWDHGPMSGALLVSHHRQPDFSICACMPHQWLHGEHRLIDYVAMTVCWAAKAFHETLLGWYPGRQHHPEWSRLERGRPNEYCGCGSSERYRDCHMASDRKLTEEDLARAERDTRHLYFQELAREARPTSPPPSAWAPSPTQSMRELVLVDSSS